MRSLSHFDWPFFSEFHRRFALGLAEWADREVDRHIDRTDVDRTCRALVRALGDAGWLKAVVPAAYGGLSEQLDVRTLCSAREILAWNDSLADFAFAMQGLGTGSISLFGTDHLKAKYLPPVRDGLPHSCFRAFGARGRLRCQRARHYGDGGRAGFCTFGRPEDVDIKRRHRRPLRGVRADGRSSRHERIVRVRCRCRRAGAFDRRPN